MLNTFFLDCDRIVSTMQKDSRARELVECANIFLSAGNDLGAL